MKAVTDIQIRDPFVIVENNEGKYYLFGSTDEDVWGTGIGFDVYVGHDLEHWEGPYPAFRPEDSFYSDVNFWAPEVYEYKGKYYMFATFRRKDNRRLGTAVLVSETIAGPYRPHSEGPVTPGDWNSLDGTLHLDDDGMPWMVFCHEWKDVKDGEVCAVRLTADLKAAIGEPVRLFSASEAPWTTPYESEKVRASENKYVTDGPFMYRTSGGELLMLWASYIHTSYAIGLAKSVSGQITGPWQHEEVPLYKSDGGHGMIFKSLDDQLMLTIHTPNRTPEERAIFLKVAERGGTFVLLDSM
ncbi:glycoside hydrolase family 43 protein [Paenibacillus rigui]|uniref:Glycoside hydrolase n=1 Tax=Paenibacillus rigui TaxID=554312 RepID=A0A229UP04_9BACL|nr:glycoside hydrolase family 43 protein [Paenibacillus rigui]OXM85186.1 glycoside hydrolase [Paenibacillus rigui]